MRNKYVVIGKCVLMTIQYKDKTMITTFDKEHLDLVKSYDSWYAWTSKKTKQFYVRGYKNGCNQVWLHRIIMNPPKDMLIDHKNNNPLNNRNSNLRIVTSAQNQQNRRPNMQLGSSKVRNVIWDKFSNSWKVYFTRDKKRHNVGRFKTIEEAIKARDEYKSKLGIEGNL